MKENGTVEKYPEARVQIVVICPIFLQKIQSIAETETSLGKLFQPEKVVALMLGVLEQLDNDRIRTGNHIHDAYLHTICTLRVY